MKQEIKKPELKEVEKTEIKEPKKETRFERLTQLIKDLLVWKSLLTFLLEVGLFLWKHRDKILNYLLMIFIQIFD